MTSACRELYARMSALRRFLPVEAQPFIEDLTDHFERVRSVCDSEREYPQGVVDLYQSRTSVKMNIAMERLALMSAVMLRRRDPRLGAQAGLVVSGSGPAPSH